MSTLPKQDRFDAAVAVWTYVRQRNNFLGRWHNPMQLPAVQAYVTIKRATVKRHVLEGINAGENTLSDERSPAQMVAGNFFSTFRKIGETFTEPTLEQVSGAMHEPNDQFFVLFVMKLREDGWVDPVGVDKMLYAYMQLSHHKRMQVTEAVLRLRYFKEDASTFEPSKAIWKAFIDYALSTYRDYRLVND